MPSIWMIIALVLLFVIATVWTLVIFKQEENKIKKYEEEGDTVENEIKRSLEYETKSLKSNIPILTWIYSITIIVSLVVFAFYLV